ncbi:MULTISPECIES: hypothetical protein [unclassified Enterococcus]|uniref:hypothetical protein n=1 Tax=unclassified Enterococcus TaxID=2608891 RepID=UPI001F14DA54|nr:MULTISPECIES: hypothetical protein [unclassified Enterococcus]
MKKTKTVSHYGSVVFMIAVLLLSHFTGLSQITFAKEGPEEVVTDGQAKIMIDYEIDEELQQIQWLMTYEKHVFDEADYQMQFKLEIAEHEELLMRESIQEIERTFGKVGQVDEEWYYAGDFSTEDEKVEIAFKSHIVEEVEQYHLKITPRLMKQTEEGSEEILIGDQEEYMVAVVLPENTAVSETAETSEDSTEISKELEESREETLEEDQKEMEEAEVYAAPNMSDPNLNGAYDDAISLKSLFTVPDYLTLVRNVPKFLDENKRIEITPSDFLTALYNRGHMVSKNQNTIEFSSMTSDIGFTTYMYFDTYTEGISFFLHDGNPTSLFYSRRGIHNKYDPSVVTNHDTKALGAYRHKDPLGVFDIDRHMINAMVLEFDNQVSTGPLLNRDKYGDNEFSGAHIAVASSEDPTAKSFKKDFGTNNAFVTGSWWQLNVNISPTGILHFSMTDLREGGHGTTTGDINIGDYYPEFRSKKLFWGFAATATYARDNQTTLFMTNPNFDIQGELVHEITVQGQSGAENVHGHTVPADTELEHTVTFYNDDGDGSIFLTPNSENGLTILTSELEESKSNPFDFTEMVPLDEDYHPYFTYQTINSDDKIEEHQVEAIYDQVLQRFYPVSTIEILNGTILRLNYKTKVLSEFQSYADFNVYERVAFRGRSLSTTGSFYDAQVEQAVQYAIQRDPNTPPELENLRTVNSQSIETTLFTDFKDPFRFAFDYGDGDLDRLYYSVWINGEILAENQLILNAREELQTFGSARFNIDLKDADGIFQIGENTLTVTLTDNRIDEPLMLETTF